MGGDPQRHEPADHRVILVDENTCNLFQQRGWLDYQLSLKQFDEEISLQFHNSLQEGHAMVKGVRIEFIEQVMAEVTVLPIVRERWSKDIDARAAKAQFALHDDPPLQEDKK